MGIFKKIIDLFSGKSKIDAEGAEISRKLQNFLQNQIDTLNSEGHRVLFNEITIGYISHLIMMITKKPINLNVVHNALINIFTDEHSFIMINNALQIFSGDVETEVKLAALFPIVKKEYDTGSGDFLVRHTRKVHKNIKSMYSKDTNFDLRELPRWTAADLA